MVCFYVMWCNIEEMAKSSAFTQRFTIGEDREMMSLLDEIISSERFASYSHAHRYFFRYRLRHEGKKWANSEKPSLSTSG